MVATAKNKGERNLKNAANEQTLAPPDAVAEPWPPGAEDGIARELVLKKMRETVDMVKTWEMCGRPACLKSRGCRDRQVTCFDEFREAIQGTIQELADWERFEGPYEESFYATVAADIRKAMDCGEI